MTRRIIMFVDSDGMRYVSPEFNGDKTELKASGSADSCTKTFYQMLRDIWANVDCYDAFRKANLRAQVCYRSSLGIVDAEDVVRWPWRDRLPDKVDELITLTPSARGKEPYITVLQGSDVVADGVTVSEYLATIQDTDDPLPTKEEVKDRLMAGETLESIFSFSSGQECDIFKAPRFVPGDQVIYIPDISRLPTARDISVDIEGIFELLGELYTGNNFLEMCVNEYGEGEYAKKQAERLFDYVDWQHPEAVLDAGEIDDENE